MRVFGAWRIRSEVCGSVCWLIGCKWLSGIVPAVWAMMLALICRVQRPSSCWRAHSSWSKFGANAVLWRRYVIDECSLHASLQSVFLTACAECHWR
jgi:hypothetical protein